MPPESTGLESSTEKPTRRKIPSIKAREAAQAKESKPIGSVQAKRLPGRSQKLTNTMLDSQSDSVPPESIPTIKHKTSDVLKEGQANEPKAGVKRGPGRPRKVATDSANIQPTVNNITPSIQSVEIVDEVVDLPDDSVDLYAEEPSELELTRAASLVVMGSDDDEAREDNREEFDLDEVSDDEEFDITTVRKSGQAVSSATQTQRLSRSSQDTKIVIQVSDGHAARDLTICKSWRFCVLLHQTEDIMKTPRSHISLVYEAPWCKRTGLKMVPHYLENDDDYAKLFSRYKEYMDAQQKKKKGGAASKATSRKTNETKASDSWSNSNNAKTSMLSIIAEKLQEIEANFYCQKHSRTCYKTYHGEHKLYTNDHLTTHARLLSKGVKGVTAKDVPEQLKIMDYIKPSKAREKAVGDNMGDLADVKSSVGVTIQDSLSQPVMPPSEGILHQKVRDWLYACTTRQDRGQDGHDYMALADVFEQNEITRLDDITFLTTKDIIDLAHDCGVTVSRGLANRIIRYSNEDIKDHKGKGKE
ncbi:uncharacterized protein FOMMEDRAFT_162128 [Fomitiporia mediterranea MF3/22]|uniref:uncharacterized protein n=1 Tax=Fomitiporia mediterranea (strain MF3/22) TaxID=694068 RepID=UPI000440998D|nr:uncharacterized protein FOMMEDRAFT_162128 [Fomitiporia mediterranea MF3/22]EJC98330.1 hypothetical protein FOMMEDRAFT_162128 [Fomitiporia mediterranea MF3/22]